MKMHNNKITLCIALFILISSQLYTSEDIIIIPEIKALYGTGGRICARPFTDFRGRVSVLSEDRYLYIFSPDGELLDKNRLPEKPSDYITMGFDGIIYAFFSGSSGSSRSLKAVNPKGMVIWSAKTENPPAAAPVAALHGNIAAADTSGKVYSYTPTGRLRWQIETGSGIIHLSDSGKYGTLFAALENNTVAVINNAGEIRKTIILNSPAAGTAYSLDDGLIFIAEKNGTIHIYTDDMVFVRNIFTGLNISAHFYDINNMLVITSRGGLRAISPDSSVLFSRPDSSNYTGEPVIFRDSVFFVRKDGYISKVGKSGGRDINLPVPLDSVKGFRGFEKNEITAGIARSGETIIFGGQDWVVYFIDTKERVYKYEILLKRPAAQEMRTLPQRGNLFRYIEELYSAGSYDNYEKILDLLEELISNGIKKGSDEYYTLEMLEKIGKEGISGNSARSASAAAGIRQTAFLRSRAAGLLSETGTQASINILRAMLDKETDPYLIPRIIRILGNYGSDPYGESAGILVRTVNRYPADKRISESVLYALKKISDYHGFMPAQETRSLLIKMLDNAGDTELKLSIMNVLKTIQW